MSRQRTAHARIVTPDLTYQKYGFLIDDDTATVLDRHRVSVRMLTAIELTVIDGGGRKRIAGTNELGDPEVWTVDGLGCGCGMGVTIVPTVDVEVPV